MVKKSDIVREAVREQDWKKALQIAKDFHIGVTQEQRCKMTRAYECIVHPDFYRQIGVDIPEAIEQGKAIVKEYAESIRRKNTMMKWDVKHDRAKRVIGAFLDNAEYWQKREELSEGLTDEEKELVSGEISLMIASIRKRYKLDVRLTTQEAQIQPKQDETVDSNTKTEETPLTAVNEEKAEVKSKRRKASSETEEKPKTRKPRARKKAEEPAEAKL